MSFAAYPLSNINDSAKPIFLNAGVERILSPTQDSFTASMHALARPHQ